MAKHKFAICELGPRWQFVSPLHSCVKHKVIDVASIAKRRQWLGRIVETKRETSFKG